MPVPAAVALDLDGVIWLAHEPIPGSVDAVARLRAAGAEVVFVTNNALPVVADHEAKLAALGIPAEGAVLTAPMGAARLLEAGMRVLVAGGPGVREAVEGAGAHPVDYAEADAVPGAIDAVVVGLHRDFDWDRCRIAATAIRAGARFVATNDDATYPTPTGLVPGAGAIVAAIATAAGQAPEVAGKPHAPLAAVVRERCGPDGVMVGDRFDTDGAFAERLGWPFALVLTGVAGGIDESGGVHASEIAPDLAALVERWLPA